MLRSHMFSQVGEKHWAPPQQLLLLMRAVLLPLNMEMSSCPETQRRHFSRGKRSLTGIAWSRQDQTSDFLVVNLMPYQLNGVPVESCRSRGTNLLREGVD